MRHLDIVKLIPLSFCIAFAPVQPVEAANPVASSERPSLAATSASKLVRNGPSLDGRSRGRLAGNGVNLNGRKMNGVSLGGHTIRTDGGMTVVSIRLPGAERRSK